LHRRGSALGKQLRAVELAQLLFRQPTHEIGDIDLLLCAARTSFENVGIDERHEKLEILVVAVMRRRRHQQ
jgi:hypothetical protein